MALAIDSRLLTNLELVEECLLNGTDTEKRLASIAVDMQNTIHQLEDELEERYNWES